MVPVAIDANVQLHNIENWVPSKMSQFEMEVYEKHVQQLNSSSDIFN